ncbi:MAG: DUF1674 domain-containing protein [Notoacmeibacter sp.]|nr:DUF1674 domain-containing protein [Notoacmeibacter sp.]
MNEKSAADTGRRFEDLPPAAQRALKEAEARRAAYEKNVSGMPVEVGGRGGKEPVRYGDYEVKGLAVDF